MLKALFARRHQGHRTIAYPAGPAQLPELFRGAPFLDPEMCPGGCADCANACPHGAITAGTGDQGPGTGKTLALDMGKCLFCPECAGACPHGAISFTGDHRLAVNRREDLIVRSGEVRRLAPPLDATRQFLFSHSLKLREVSAGGCNACEADTNVLSTVGFDLGRFGIQFVASPRHADGIFITGPVTENMHLALLKTWEAIPEPKIAIAAGACAINGGPFIDSPDVHNGADGLIPIDLYIPGCPPHPLTILDGLLRILGRLEE
ncbi:Ech-hydrogenase-related complex, small subunit [Geobacter metallireducens GS-15]|uniref:Ech-hydrogenase-related complex, small subunit n=1 Tax=Geobacter metallireducens (strain ATCC 53774 / DSM 7210 / GS-15) TaxID=269799 RepID=Q39YR2_GEOMG|nr:4Fe-4S dicluster domain-containing protein [Geobacter metallireducens]ABB30612.1 Ech-hydrogenase-related complex, small subunit [Geobacter metallireducens GS-15]